MVPAVALLFSALTAVDPSPPRWHGGVLFDDGVRAALHAPTLAGRTAADQASNVFLYSMVAIPTISAGAEVAARGAPWQDAAELVAVNAEALGLTWGLVTLVKAITKRERPWATAAHVSARCAEHPKDAECGGDRNASFFSGHSATAFAGAGLVCAQELADEPRFAAIGCSAALGVAAATALLRIVADRHYATDTIVGALVGLGTGLLLPWVLHFAPWAPLPVARDLRPDAPRPAPIAATASALTPWAAPGGAGVALTVPF